jgi:Spy/CpxP family protein refolding chaperone
MKKFRPTTKLFLQLVIIGSIAITLFDSSALAQQGRRFRERLNRERFNNNNLNAPRNAVPLNNNNLSNPNLTSPSNTTNANPPDALDTFEQDPILGGPSGGQQRLDRLQRRQDRQERRLERQNEDGLGGVGGFGGGLSMRAWVKLLKLNNEQLQRFQQIRRNSAMSYLQLQVQIRRKNQELQRTIYNETYNEEAIKQVAIELARLEGQRMLMRARIQTQIRQVLTTEQVRTLNDLRSGSNEADLSDDVPSPPANVTKPENPDRKE